MRHAIITTLLLSCLIGGRALAAAEAVVIAHAGVKQTTMSRANLKNVYLGKKNQWGDNSRITLTVLGSREVHDAFVRRLITMSPGRFDRFWKQLVFTGRAKMPQHCDNEAAVLAFVAATPGAIGYVSPTALEGASGIKQISIQ